MVQKLNFIVIVVLITVFQILRIRSYPLLPEELSMLNSNFSAEPLLDDYFFKLDQPLDVSFLSNLPFQAIQIALNFFGIYGYDVFLVKYSFNFVIAITLMTYFYSKINKISFYFSLLATIIISTTLIFDQLMIYSPRINSLIIIISIFIKYLLYNDLNQNRKIIKMLALNFIIFVYSFGLFANIGNAVLCLLPLILEIIRIYMTQTGFNYEKIRNLLIPYAFLLPSLIISVLLIRGSQILSTPQFNNPEFFPTKSITSLIQGRGSWWESSYLPWFPNLIDEHLVVFRSVIFLLIFLPLILFVVHTLKIEIKITLNKIFNKNNYILKKKFYLIDSSIFDQHKSLYLYSLLVFIFTLLITKYFPSEFLFDLNPYFYIFREPWSKFGIIFIISFGQILALTFHMIFTPLRHLLLKKLGFFSLKTLSTCVATFLFIWLNPSRYPIISFAPEIDYKLDYKYANYLSKSVLRINSMEKIKGDTYVFCLVPGNNFYENVLLGRWFFAYSYNVPHYSVSGERKLGANAYDQFGIPVNRCDEIYSFYERDIRILKICLPHSIHPNKNCDYRLRRIPI